MKYQQWSIPELPAGAVDRLTGAGYPYLVSSVLASAELPANVVSMNSEFDVLDLCSHGTRRLTLCYPGDADAERGRISVLSPVGLSLLGCAVGSEARWQAGGGPGGALRIQALHYQPEASGDLTR